MDVIKVMKSYTLSDIKIDEENNEYKELVILGEDDFVLEILKVDKNINNDNFVEKTGFVIDYSTWIIDID
jgi:hypothetical protein